MSRLVICKSTDRRISFPEPEGGCRDIGQISPRKNRDDVVKITLWKLYKLAKEQDEDEAMFWMIFSICSVGLLIVYNKRECARSCIKT